MPDLTKEVCYQKLADIYSRSAEPGWEKMVSILSVGEKGGVWLSCTSYVYYPGQDPKTFAPNSFDEDDEMLEHKASSLFLDIWEIDGQAGHKWYNATYTFYPDQRFEFAPTVEPEKAFSETLSTPTAP
ncbi:MAG: hypothetical protein ACO1RX_20240 [Candidatus Sericytochromatia bacterium]